MHHALFVITVLQLVGLVFVVRFLLTFFPLTALLKSIYLPVTGLAVSGLLLAGLTIFTGQDATLAMAVNAAMLPFWAGFFVKRRKFLAFYRQQLRRFIAATEAATTPRRWSEIV